MVARLKSVIDEPANAPAPVIVVGNGPVGVKVVAEMARREPSQPIVIYGDEPWEPYNRVGLSSLLAGETSVDKLFQILDTGTNTSVTQYKNCRIEMILPEQKQVIDQYGNIKKYRALVLATGSHPHVPAIPGIDLPGIYTFRNYSDAQSLKARQQMSRRTVVVGGGLLGLETARAMQRENIEVTVIDHSPWLMSAQLNADAAELLNEYLLKTGIRYSVGSGIRRFEGEHGVERVVLQNGREIECDTVVLATGIKPNVELALKAGIAIGRGIRVDDTMETSVRDIYATGDCVEHRGRVSGLVAPGLEQAQVAVNSILGGRSRYNGAIAASRLKVFDLPVFSMGEISDESSKIVTKSLVYHNPDKNIYRKLIIKRNRVIGCIAIGDWPSQTRVQTLITRKSFIWPWQRVLFVNAGEIWPEGDYDSVVTWPNKAVVCTCIGVTRGQLGDAINNGCKTVACLAEHSRASTACGSCRPQLAELVGSEISQEPIPGKKSLLSLSTSAVLLAFVIFFFNPRETATSVVSGWHISELWLDGLFKQVSGYSMLVLVLASLVLSLSKRAKWFNIGSFVSWRMVHLSLGVLTLLTLLTHTGLRLGHNFNQLMMVNFLVVVFLGSMAGAITALETNIGGSLGKRLRQWWNRFHLIAAWPLPVLIAGHVVSVYYF